MLTTWPHRQSTGNNIYLPNQHLPSKSTFTFQINSEHSQYRSSHSFLPIYKEQEKGKSCIRSRGFLFVCWLFFVGMVIFKGFDYLALAPTVLVTVVNNNNNEHISRAPFHVKHAQLHWTSANTKIHCMHIRHPKHHVSKQSCSNIQRSSKDGH